MVRNADGSVVRWQEGDNVSLELPGGPAEALALDVEDSWNKSKQVGFCSSFYDHVCVTAVLFICLCDRCLQRFEMDGL